MDDIWLVELETVVLPLHKWSRGGAPNEDCCVLAIDNGCLYYDGLTSRAWMLWPEGTTWIEEERALQFPDGQTITEGDPIPGLGVFIDIPNPLFTEFSTSPCLVGIREVGVLTFQ